MFLLTGTSHPFNSEAIVRQAARSFSCCHGIHSGCRTNKSGRADILSAEVSWFQSCCRKPSCPPNLPAYVARNYLLKVSHLRPFARVRQTSRQAIVNTRQCPQNLTRQELWSQHNFMRLQDLLYDYQDMFYHTTARALLVWPILWSRNMSHDQRRFPLIARQFHHNRKCRIFMKQEGMSCDHRTNTWIIGHALLHRTSLNPKGELE